MTLTFPGHSALAVGFEVPLAQADVSGFTQLCERHIAREESELLPMAQRLLSDAELDRVGLATRMRRAVPGAPTLLVESSEPSALIDHILVRFHEVHRQQLPELIRLAAKVEAAHAEHAATPRGLTALLKSMHSALLAHMEKEEALLIPMLVRGGNAFVLHPIGVMRAEHDEHAQRLAQLLALTQNATPPADACTTWRQLSASVRQFADDLQHHIRLENDVLFPQFVLPQG